MGSLSQEFVQEFADSDAKSISSAVPALVRDEPKAPHLTFHRFRFHHRHRTHEVCMAAVSGPAGQQTGCVPCHWGGDL